MMSQHSDELIEHDPEKLERCACALFTFGPWPEGLPAPRWDEQDGHEKDTWRRQARAVLDEAAKPDPGGPAMREGWQWWAGTNDEWFTYGPFATRQEALDEALSDGVEGVFLVEALNPPLRLADWVEAYRLLERAEEVISDSDRVAAENDDGPFFECTPEQEKDLKARIERACDDWQAAHGLVFTCKTFDRQRNNEYVPLPAPPEPTVPSVPPRVDGEGE